MWIPSDLVGSAMWGALFEWTLLRFDKELARFSDIVRLLNMKPTDDRLSGKTEMFQFSSFNQMDP